MCNIDTNDIFDDGQFSYSKEWKLFAHNEFPHYEQGDQQSVHNIPNESVDKGQLSTILPMNSLTYGEITCEQGDQQGLRNIGANNKLDDGFIFYQDYQSSLHNIANK